MKKHGNVYDIGTGKRSIPRDAANQDGRVSSSETDQPAVDDKARPSRFGLFMRHLLVMLLMWVRGPIRFISNLFVVPATIALPIVIFGLDSSPQKTAIIMGLIGVSFGLFCLRWLFDSLIMWISPDPLVMNS
jgi:hypothetical protein